MSDGETKEMTLREYAAREKITLQTAYRRIWDGRVNARQLYGRWLISPDQQPRCSRQECVSA
jgi:hypothetical protein